MEAGSPGPLALVVDCPSEDYLPALRSDPVLRRLQEIGVAAASKTQQPRRRALACPPSLLAQLSHEDICNDENELCRDREAVMALQPFRLFAMLQQPPYQNLDPLHSLQYVHAERLVSNVANI